jgi:hypothetical protein
VNNASSGILRGLKALRPPVFWRPHLEWGGVVRIGETETVGTADFGYLCCVTSNKTRAKTKSCSFLYAENRFLQNHTKKGIFQNQLGAQGYFLSFDPTQ